MQLYKCIVNTLIKMQRLKKNILFEFLEGSIPQQEKQIGKEGGQLDPPPFITAMFPSNALIYASKAVKFCMQKALA